MFTTTATITIYGFNEFIAHWIIHQECPLQSLNFNTDKEVLHQELTVLQMYIIFIVTTLQ